MPNKIKQVIVVRKDLKMRKGKCAAQAAHASMKVFLDVSEIDTQDSTLTCRLTIPMQEWLQGSFAKICLYVNSEEELLELYEKARKEKLPCSLITDSGRTEFHGVPTNTCIAIGPDYSDKIDKLTGNLPLY